MDQYSFGTWLEDTRGGMPLRSFAEQVGVDAGTISRTERNCTDVLVPTAVRICRGLGLSLGDFFQNWQGVSIVAADQLGQELWQGALTGVDVQRWLIRLFEGHRRNREMLISALNLIVLRSGLLTTPLPQMIQLFSLADIEKMLWDLPWFRYEVAPPLHCESIIADLAPIYQRGGLILPSELGVYISKLRRQEGFSLKQLSEEIRIPIGTLSSVENGMIKHFKLCDLLHIDASLQRRGELIALYWWEVSNRQTLEQEWNQLPLAAAYSPRVKHTLTSLLISVGRWLQVIYQDDTEWLRAIRHELDLAQPALMTAAAHEKAPMGS
ncbi:MAG: helix-turn-helix transcriptional regulator [Ktedonobacteraceae bacterium]|nr:helix-turn-helix transcriptional regulator [Ktedonobacteraceae bacterium]